MPEIISIDSTKILQRAWEIFKKDWKIISVIMLLSTIVGRLSSRDGNSGLIDLAIFLASIIFTMISTLVSLKLVRGQSVTMEDITGLKNKAWPFIKTYIRYFLYIIGGLLLLIIPGIYFALKYGFALYLSIDQTDSSGEAMNMSAKMTEGVKGQLIVFGIISVILNIVGLIALYIGVIVTSAVTIIGFALIYEQLLQRVKPSMEGLPIAPVTGPGMTPDAMSPYGSEHPPTPTV